MARRKRKPLPTTEVVTTITALSHDGRGIAHIDGKTTFIFGALPGETVSFVYTNKRSQFDEGKVIHVLTPTSLRNQDALCPVFGICGGCSLQHLQHDAQLKAKQATVLELLQHQAQLIPEKILPPLQSHPWQYRQKARLGVKFVAKKNKMIIGFRERAGRLITDVPYCDVLHPNVGQRIRSLADLIYNLNARDAIPQLEVAIGDNATAIIIRHLTPLNEHDCTLLKSYAAQQQLRFYLQPKGLDSITLFYPENTDPLLCYTLPEYALTLQFAPQQFTQVNANINQQMIHRAINLLELQPNDHVLDLFCGIGNFSLPIAKFAAHVVGVEGDASAILQAKNNAKFNHIDNTDFFCADLFQNAYTYPWAQANYSKILLDPPRAGAKEMITWLGQHASRINPNIIVYVSCNPATFARDAALLKAQGYRLSALGVMDMFPHTQHIELIAQFLNENRTHTATMAH